MSKGKWAEKLDGEGVLNPTCAHYPNQVEPQPLATALDSLPALRWGPFIPAHCGEGASQVTDCPVVRQRGRAGSQSYFKVSVTILSVSCSTHLTL